MLIKFVARAGMTTWRDHIGKWRNGQVKEVDKRYGKRLLGLFRSPFVEENFTSKSLAPKDDKMMHGSEEEKTEEETPEEMNESGKSSDRKEPQKKTDEKSEKKEEKKKNRLQEMFNRDKDK